MITSKTKNSKISYLENMNANSPKNGVNTLIYSNILDSPKSLCKNYQSSSLSSSKLYTQTSKNLNLQKFSSINNLTNSNSSRSINSSLKYPVSTYISCNTLQTSIPSYSIPKTRRFKNSYREAYCDNIYNLPQHKSTIVSFGNGVRKDLYDKSKYPLPSPQDYLFSSIFDDNISKNRGFSITERPKVKVSSFPSIHAYI